MSAKAERQFDYDLFCIGAGSGGVRTSRMSASYGAKVGICEMPWHPISSDTHGGVGGTCVLRGCVPKKLMVYGSEFSESFSDSAGFGWSLGGAPSFDYATFKAAKNKELERLNGIYHRLLANAGVELIEGRGKLVGPHEVEISTADGPKRVTAAKILVAPGSKAWAPPMPGLEHTITSDHALELDAFPKKMFIVGGGYIGIEFACIFQGLGVEVHYSFRGEYPLKGFDEECRKFLTEQIDHHHNLTLHKNWTPTEVVKQADGRYTLKAKDSSGAEHEVKDLDQVMMATGRKPNTANMGLEDVGVELDAKSGAIKVDEYSRTNVPSIYAIGDVTDRIQLTPVALMEGMALAKTLFNNEPTSPDHEAVPSAVFSQPSLASCGLTEEQALQKHPDLDVYSSSFRPMRATLSGSPMRALMKLLVDAKTSRVVGCHMVGPEAGEIMQGMGLAVKLGVTKAQLDSLVGIHPSTAEEFVTMRSPARKFRAGKLQE
ncbi:unnamed protein product [Pedinophyceae sp. YPF-701]|nr:unnamed protein product [Pedinophyceae sp. YPF-701]